jgi:hypothetical protein
MDSTKDYLADMAKQMPHAVGTAMLVLRIAYTIYKNCKS